MLYAGFEVLTAADPYSPLKSPNVSEEHIVSIMWVEE
jgi:hypothetical protein